MNRQPLRTTSAADRSTPIYLDHAAATVVRPEVRDAMEEAQTVGFGNPSSLHAAGRQAKRLLEEARERILDCCGARATGSGRDRLVFTSGATEANRLAILGSVGEVAGRCFYSARDHASVATAAAELQRRDWTVRLVPLAQTGTLDLGDVVAPIAASHPALLCITLACGQTGVVEELAATRTAWSGQLHVDATQAVGRMRIDCAALRATTLALAPHKFGGPRGIGGLIVTGDARLVPIAPGAQEAGLRGGTEPVFLAVGFARAIELAVAERETEAARLAALRETFEAEIVAAAGQAGIAAFVVGAGSPRVPHVSTLVFPGVDRQAFVMAADMQGVCAATGTACASGSREPAAVLQAIGLSPALAQSAVRFSFGWTTTSADIANAVMRIGHILDRLATAAGHVARP